MLLPGTLDLQLDAPALGLGALGVARVVPVVVFALFGGLLADVRDRRDLMMRAQAAAALTAVCLAAVTFAGLDSLPILYALTAAGAAASAFDNPARQSLVPRLVHARDLANAVSLNTLLWQIGTIAGPAVAGVLTARFDVALVYAVDAVSFLAVLEALRRMDYRGGAAETAKLSVDAFVEGLRFTYNAKIIWGTMLLDFFATLLSNARTMLPIVAEEILGVGVTGYGVLATAQAVGAVVAGALLAMRRDIVRQGPVLFASVVVYGAATALFGVSAHFAASYLLFALTGAADTVSTVIRGTIRQLVTPDRLRGRMTSVNMVFFMGGPQLGEARAGVVAAVLGAPLAIASGGLATVAVALVIARRFPALAAYRRDDAEDASA
jgi:MFS family permease